MERLNIDIETYSEAELARCGVYKYAENIHFEILLFGYAADGGEVQTVDLASGEKLPDDVLRAMTDNSIIKWAFNAQFERICLSRYLRDLGILKSGFLDPAGWRCTMIWSAYMGLPLSLKSVGAVLGLEKQKLSEGDKLIRYFSRPCSPTKANGGRTRNYPEDAPLDWLDFKRYNIRDVETEMGIQRKLQKHPVPEFVWEEYRIDQQINDRGVRLDLQLMQQAITMDNRAHTELSETMRQLTGLENPDSASQMKLWLSGQGLQADSVDKKAVSAMLKTTEGMTKEVLKLRQQSARSSVAKYRAMETAVCSDGRARGMFQFYGANRTGRWAGRLIQLQNLPQNHLEDLREARTLVRNGDYETIQMLYEDVPDTLAQLIRTTFIPADGFQFCVADYSAVEARVIAWYAGEDWRLKVFEDGGDIYCASASQMFGVPVVKHGVNGHLRQKGKIAELALGYGGSTGALKAMGALEMGLDEDELPDLVSAWRESNPNITAFWWAVDKAAKKAIKDRGTAETHGVQFRWRGQVLYLTLPSGRTLAYPKADMGTNRFGGDCITYEGTDNTRQWKRLDTYGPKLVENIVQATSRDLLCSAMRSLQNMRIVMHIHDELVIEAPQETSLEEICEKMGRTPDWAPGLLLRADGYTTEFYRKD